MSSDNCNSELSSASVEDVFLKFRAELDARHDTWEKVVKLSRDVTIESKRLIFHLQRVNNNNNEKLKLLKEAESKKKYILTKLSQISVILNNDNDPQQFLRAYSPGLQEFIEADALLHYLSNESQLTQMDIHLGVLTLQSVQKTLTFQCSNDSNRALVLPVPVDEYLLGLADVTGEAMRMCINAATEETADENHKDNRSAKLCALVRTLYILFKAVSASPDEHGCGKIGSKYFSEKVRTMGNSLSKCEDACYTLHVHSAEMPKGSLKTHLEEGC